MIIGVATAYALSLHRFGVFVDGILTGLRAAILTLGVALPAYFVLFRILPPRLKRLRTTTRIALSIFALAGGFALAARLPLPQPVTHHLKITATGQKNPAALSSEVWVTELHLADGTTVPARAFSLTGDWEIRDGVPISYQTQPATLRWSSHLEKTPGFGVRGEWRIQDGRAQYPDESAMEPTRRKPRDATLHLLSHPYSGIVHITWNGHVQTVDLYSPTKTECVVPLPAGNCNAKDASSERVMLAVWAIDVLGLALLIFATAAIRLGRSRPPSAPRAQTLHPVGLLVPVGVGIVIATGLWMLGLRDVVCKPGDLQIAIDAPGVDLISLHLDAAGRHRVDIPLNRYVHEGRCAIRSETPAKAIALVGIMDDAGTLHPPNALELTGPAEPVTLPDCPYPAVWMDADHVRTFAFALEYEEARAVFFIPHDATSIDCTVDGKTETVDLKPNKKKLAHLSLRSAQRPPGVRTYTVTLPAVQISRLRLVPLASTSNVHVTEFQTSIPGLKHLEAACLPQKAPETKNEKQPATLDLVRNVRYTSAVYAQQIGLFGVCVLLGTLICWVAARTWGTGWSSVRPRQPIAVWEGAVVLLGIVGSLWLQTASMGLVTNDGVAYIARAMKSITSGQISALAGTHPPGYAAFLATVFLLGGDGATVWTINAGLLALGLIGLWLIGRRLGGPMAGCLLALWFAINPILLISSRTVLPDFLYTFGVLAWFAVVLAWASRSARGGWRWALLAGIGWALLATIRPNAVTLLAAGIVVPFLAAGTWKRRLATAACFFMVATATHFGLKALTSNGPRQHSMLAWGRTWPILQRDWLAVDAPEFRPLRQEYLIARTKLSDSPSNAFYERLLYGNVSRDEANAALQATVNASLRRWPCRTTQELWRCARFAYVYPSDQQLWQYLNWGFPNPARYERVLDSHAASASRWYNDATQQRVASFHTEHRAGSLVWDVFRWLHARTRDWRVWPISILALAGTIYAIRRREGLLLLPGVLSLVCALPLCLLFVAYDRYFLPAEVLLMLQAAVGIRAIVGALRRRSPLAQAAVAASR